MCDQRGAVPSRPGTTLPAGQQYASFLPSPSPSLFPLSPFSLSRDHRSALSAPLARVDSGHRSWDCSGRLSSLLHICVVPRPRNAESLLRAHRSRAISAMTSIIKKCLPPMFPPRRLEENMQYIIDGTLLPCWSWRADGTVLRQAQDHWHEHTGRVHFAGRLAWICDVVDGVGMRGIAWMWGLITMDLVWGGDGMSVRDVMLVRGGSHCEEHSVARLRPATYLPRCTSCAQR